MSARRPRANTTLGDLHCATPWLWLNCEPLRSTTRRSPARSRSSAGAPARRATSADRADYPFGPTKTWIAWALVFAKLYGVSVAAIPISFKAAIRASAAGRLA
jgi:hypothetical protein